MATLEELTAQVRAGVGADSGLGVIFIDGGTVSNEDLPADLTITISVENLLAMAAGRLKPAYAIMVGKLRCSDMGLLMALEEPLTALIARFV
jgi:putative sterol carrier protein